MLLVVMVFSNDLLTASKGQTTKSQLFSVLALQWWNELPADVKTAESLTSISKRLKTHLLSQNSPGLCIASLLILHPPSSSPTILKTPH